MTSAALLAIALALDAVLGEPKWLWSRIPHPTVIMGGAVDWLDRLLNTGNGRRLKGGIAVMLLAAAAWLAARLIAALPGAPVLEILLAAALLSHRSLVDHVRIVASALRISLDKGRSAVAHIVGRDAAELDQPAIARRHRKCCRKPVRRGHRTSLLVPTSRCEYEGRFHWRPKPSMRSLEIAVSRGIGHSSRQHREARNRSQGICLMELKPRSGSTGRWTKPSSYSPRRVRSFGWTVTVRYCQSGASTYESQTNRYRIPECQHNLRLGSGRRLDDIIILTHALYA